MKGISDIIAVLLMLIITIGLSSLAYSYIVGIWQSRTSVVLSLDIGATNCNSTHFIFYVRNDGNTNSGNVSISVSDPNGIDALDSSVGPCMIVGGVPAMSEVPKECKRDLTRSHPAGGYRVTISAPGAAPYIITFYCPSPSGP